MRVPYLEPVAGAVWWTVGAAALDGGVGTVVLAGGLGVTGAELVALYRRHGSGARLPVELRNRVLGVVGGAGALVAVAGAVLGIVALGELAAPLACAITGVGLVVLSSLLDERSLLAAGAALMVLGAVGALLALGSAGPLYPQGVVGLLAGALLWVTGVYRGGLVAQARGRARH